jgi:hypothetical protein
MTVRELDLLLYLLKHNHSTITRNNIWITCGKPMIILQEEALMYLSADYVNISAMIKSKIQSLRGIGFEIDFPTD